MGKLCTIRKTTSPLHNSIYHLQTPVKQYPPHCKNTFYWMKYVHATPWPLLWIFKWKHKKQQEQQIIKVNKNRSIPKHEQLQETGVPLLHTQDDQILILYPLYFNKMKHIY